MNYFKLFWLITLSGLFSLPYCLDFWVLPKTEGFEYSFIPAALYLADTSAYWNHTAGLGIPVPLSSWYSSVFSPLKPLFLNLPFAQAFLVFTHSIILGVAAVVLYRHWAIRGWPLYVAVLTLMGGSSLELLWWSDSVIVYATWCIFVLQFLLVVLVLDKKLHKEKAFYCLILGISTGYIILNGHIGWYSVYALCILVFLIFRIKALSQNILYFMIAALVGLTIGAENIVILLREVSYFPEDTPRRSQSYYGGLVGFMQAMFFRPFAVSELHTEPTRLVVSWIEQNTFNRTFGFGPFFSVLLLVGFFYKLSSSNLKFPHGTVAAFFCFTILFFLPPQWFGGLISGTWTFRDGMHLLGIGFAALSAQYFLNSASNKSRKMAGFAKVSVAGQAIIMIATISLYVFAPLMLNLDRALTRKDLKQWAAGDVGSLCAQRLKEVVSQDLGLTRIAATKRAGHLMDREVFPRAGCVNNLWQQVGFADVSFVAKGVSLEQFRPYRVLPYGWISSDQFLHNQGLLDVLGIQAVIALEQEHEKGNSKGEVHLLADENNIRLSVRTNQSEGRIVRFVKTGALDQELSVYDETCSFSKALVCQNFTSIQKNTRKERLRVTYGKNSIKLRATPADHPRSTLGAFMFRPEWLGRDDTDRKIMLSDWYGLWRFDWPPGVSEITFNYQPKPQIIASNMSFLSSLISLLLGFLILVSRNCRQKQLKTIA